MWNLRRILLALWEMFKFFALNILSLLLWMVLLNILYFRDGFFLSCSLCVNAFRLVYFILIQERPACRQTQMDKIWREQWETSGLTFVRHWEHIFLYVRSATSCESSFQLCCAHNQIPYFLLEIFDPIETL